MRRKWSDKTVQDAEEMKDTDFTVAQPHCAIKQKRCNQSAHNVLEE
jgi:hypothetical protein